MLIVDFAEKPGARRKSSHNKIRSHMGEKIVWENVAFMDVTLHSFDSIDTLPVCLFIPFSLQTPFIQLFANYSFQCFHFRILKDFPRFSLYMKNEYLTWSFSLICNWLNSLSSPRFPLRKQKLPQCLYISSSLQPNS